MINNRCKVSQEQEFYLATRQIQTISFDSIKFTYRYDSMIKQFYATLVYLVYFMSAYHLFFKWSMS